MSALSITAWDVLIFGVACSLLGAMILFIWALCRAAALDDREMERMFREQNERG